MCTASRQPFVEHTRAMRSLQHCSQLKCSSGRTSSCKKHTLLVKIFVVTTRQSTWSTLHPSYTAVKPAQVLRHSQLVAGCGTHGTNKEQTKNKQQLDWLKHCKMVLEHMRLASTAQGQRKHSAATTAAACRDRPTSNKPHQGGQRAPTFVQVSKC